MIHLFDLDYSKSKLVSKERDGIVSLDPAVGYTPNDRFFVNLKKLFSEDYKRLKIGLRDDEVVYSGAEHSYFPNITILPNLENVIKEIIMGCTMGHHQGIDELKIQELYEYLGYGVMVIDKDKNNDNKEVEFVYAKPGDKIMIPSYCNMTMYNLDTKPLVSVDVSNSDLNKSTKTLQESGVGPIFCMYLNPCSKVFSIYFNREYFNREDSVGVKVENNPCTKHHIYLETIENLGDQLYDIFDKGERTREFFEKLGVKVVRASDKVLVNDISLDGSILDMEDEKYKELTNTFLLKVL